MLLCLLLVETLRDGIPGLTGTLFANFPSFNPAKAGLQSALMGTLWLMAVVIVFIVPVGIGTAIYLEEYADRNRWWNRLIGHCALAVNSGVGSLRSI